MSEGIEADTAEAPGSVVATAVRNEAMSRLVERNRENDRNHPRRSDEDCRG